MRDHERRLQRVAARLTVRQRVAALLAADPDSAPLPDDIGRGLTPATRAAFHRAAERIDRLRATTRAGLAQVESRITLLGELAERHRTTALCALLAADLEYCLETWAPRRGRRAAADRALGTVVGRAVGLLRREVKAARGAGAGGPSSPPEALLRTGVRNAHHLLRALAIEDAACAAAFDADPLPPDLRAHADRCRVDLARLIDRINGDSLILLHPPIELTDPSEEYVAVIAAICRPEEGAEGGKLVSYLPGPDPIASLTIRYLWYRLRGW